MVFSIGLNLLNTHTLLQRAEGVKRVKTHSLLDQYRVGAAKGGQARN
jgi:hypothetical protein